MFHIKITIKAILLIISNNHMNEFSSRNNFQFVNIMFDVDLIAFLIETEEMLSDFFMWGDRFHAQIMLISLIF